MSGHSKKNSRLSSLQEVDVSDADSHLICTSLNRSALPQTVLLSTTNSYVTSFVPSAIVLCNTVAHLRIRFMTYQAV